MALHAQFHVLAVDDSLIDRKLIERLLKSSSFEVTTVDSGNKALELLGLHETGNKENNLNHNHNINNNNNIHNHQDIEVNLIITDYCMPGITGFDLLRRIKESKNLKEIPVVIMSSENIPARINRCMEEGAEEFLLKPVQLSDVDKLKPHLMKSKSKEVDCIEDNHKRKSDDDCLSPHKSRIKIA
ncbi:hypothetical protein RND81_10G101800 [Saponaria officinalis]|uniref:Response regulatory domain-containing protein n=1 Tax=Saponaria officinalis TaxID=3572 RepID=A0AAW1I2L8_SAPOF